jgi:hypothetical protein
MSRRHGSLYVIDRTQGVRDGGGSDGFAIGGGDASPYEEKKKHSLKMLEDYVTTSR